MARKTERLTCCVCRRQIIPAGLEGREAQEARAAALQHAQAHLGDGNRALAQVNYWRVYSAAGGR
jgi:hypothetical protein